MTIQDGQFVEDRVDTILDAMVSNFENATGDELPPSQVSVVRTLYRPIAEQLGEAQGDVGLVFSSTQIDYAEGTALDLLTALIGVQRRAAVRATGEVRFYRETAAGTDYQIPRGTKVTTDTGVNPEEFRTTETATLASGATEVFVPIEATERGVDGNVGSNAITRMPKRPSGIESVTNPDPTDGGKDEEDDTELRERAKSELAEGSAATAAALVSACKGIPDSRSVSIFINDTNEDETDGLPAHSFELVVEGATDQEVADAIMNTKAAGDTSWYGVNGSQASATVEIVNGQQFDVFFSRPNEVTVYVDADLTVSSEYEGDDAVMNEIVEYIGGFRTSGNTDDGKLRVGDDVVYNNVLAAIMNIDGVEDVTDLQIAKTDPPSGTTNLSMGQTDAPTTDSTAGDITLTTTEV